VRAYFDTSALLKLLVSEPGAAEAIACWTGSEDQYASRIGYVELRAAAARLLREGRVRPEDGRQLRTDLEVLWRGLIAVLVDAAVIRHAGGLAELHGLRALDAIHLAAAVRVAAPGDPLRFVSFDVRLRAAAAAEGLVVLPQAL